MGYVVIYDIYIMIYHNMWYVIYDIWYNYDMWHLINDIWHVFHIWYMICESYYHIIYDRIFNIAKLMCIYIYIHVYFILDIYILCTIDYILYTWYCRLHIQCTTIYHIPDTMYTTHNLVCTQFYILLRYRILYYNMHYTKYYNTHYTKYYNIYYIKYILHWYLKYTQ